MKISLLDTKTGEIVDIESDLSPYMWAEGNWSDDCNRIGYFSEETQKDCFKEHVARCRIDEPELAEDYCEHVCLGSHRFLVIAPTIIQDDEYCFDLFEINSSYSDELIKTYIGIKQ
jgi:hypothetical protein